MAEPHEESVDREGSSPLAGQQVIAEGVDEEPIEGNRRLFSGPAYIFIAALASVNTMTMAVLERIYTQLDLGDIDAQLLNDAGDVLDSSGTVGDEPAVLMIAQLNDEKWVAAKPGDFT